LRESTAAAAAVVAAAVVACEKVRGRVLACPECSTVLVNMPFVLMTRLDGFEAESQVLSQLLSHVFPWLILFPL
jgi:hypothetical protein